MSDDIRVDTEAFKKTFRLKAKTITPQEPTQQEVALSLEDQNPKQLPLAVKKEESVGIVLNENISKYTCSFSS